MGFCLLILASFAVTNLVWTSASARPDSLDEIAYQAPVCHAEQKEEWSYRGSNGQDNWSERFPQCHGRSQSPIAVETSQVTLNNAIEQLTFIWYFWPIRNFRILNDGRTIKVFPDFIGFRQIMCNNTYYQLEEIHFHWGPNKRRGSEHIIDGEQYAMEMHLVHRRENETAVVAVFFKEFDGHNPEMQAIVNELPNVMYKNSTVNSTCFHLNLENLIPCFGQRSFYFYIGSLTVPDCSENVTWVLMKNPLFIGKEQLKQFRELFSVTEDHATQACKITNNVRHIQHRHNRPVFASK